MKHILLSAALLLPSMNGQRPASAAYDDQRKVKLSGPIAKIDWTNPDAFIMVNVKDASGTVAAWEVEIGNPLDLEKSGSKRDAVHVGDVVNIEGIPARGAAPQAR